MIKAEEILEKKRKKEEEFQDIYTQMDEDYDLWNLKPRIFDTHKMAINITSNDPRSLFDKVHSYLAGSKVLPRVFPPDNYPSPNANDVASDEERLYYFILEQVDIRLKRLLEARLLNTMAWHALARGMIAVRVLVYLDKEGKIVWDVLPLDARYTTFAVGRNGLSWETYTTFRDPESLKEDYKVELTGEANKGVEVIDYWDREVNVILTKDGTLLQEPKEHKIGEVPVVIHPVAMNARVLDPHSTRMASWGQSIFAPNRLTYKQLDEMRSILATQAHLLAKAPVAFVSELGAAPYTMNEMEFYAGATMNLPPGVKPMVLPFPNIPDSLQVAIGLFRAEIQRATYSDVEYGQLAFQLSGTALRMLKVEMDKVAGPRKAAIVDAYIDIFRMIKKQVIRQGLTVPIKSVYKNQYKVYNMVPALLDNDFYVSVDLTVENPWEELERYQLGEMAAKNRFMSKLGIMENIIKLPDPQAEIDKMNVEDVEANLPQLKLLKAGEVYAKTGQERELAIIAKEQQQGIIQKEAGAAEAIKPQEVM